MGDSKWMVMYLACAGGITVSSIQFEERDSRLQRGCVRANRGMYNNLEAPHTKSSTYFFKTSKRSRINPSNFTLSFPSTVSLIGVDRLISSLLRFPGLTIEEAAVLEGGVGLSSPVGVDMATESACACYRDEIGDIKRA
jgi:hypothetical protein